MRTTTKNWLKFDFLWCISFITNSSFVRLPIFEVHSTVSRHWLCMSRSTYLQATDKLKTHNANGCRVFVMCVCCFFSLCLLQIFKHSVFFLFLFTKSKCANIVWPPNIWVVLPVVFHYIENMFVFLHFLCRSVCWIISININELMSAIKQVVRF